MIILDSMHINTIHSFQSLKFEHTKKKGLGQAHVDFLDRSKQFHMRR